MARPRAKTPESEARERAYTLFTFDGHKYVRVGELTNRNGNAVAQEWINRHPEDSDKAFMAVPSRYAKLVRFEKEVKMSLKPKPVSHDDPPWGEVPVPDDAE